MFSTDFIFRQQENLVDNQKCHAGFRLLCKLVLAFVPLTFCIIDIFVPLTFCIFVISHHWHFATSTFSRETQQNTILFPQTYFCQKNEATEITNYSMPDNILAWQLMFHGWFSKKNDRSNIHFSSHHLDWYIANHVPNNLFLWLLLYLHTLYIHVI